MLKLSIKPLGAAISLALVSVAAHAQLVPPTQGGSVPGTSETGLYLEAWNATTGATELVNLSYAYTDIASSNLGNLNTATGSAWTPATNPSTGTGSVEQLNFGTIANNSAGAFTNFTVVSAATATQTGITHIEGVSLGSGSAPAITGTAGLTPVIQNIQTEIADWASLTTSGTFFDPTGGSTANALSGPLNGGGWNNGQISAGTVGTALSFYNIIGNTYVTTADGLAAHTTATTTYNGFWFLSSTGQLTYNLVAAAPVPLPAAIWLLGSGLLGLIGVGRRRAAAV